MFISFLDMFLATVCPSLGETTVFMRHLVRIILYGWLSVMVVSPDDGHLVTQNI